MNVPSKLSKMPSIMPYAVPYQNQLQFNLGVPVTTGNLAVQFRHPAPIIVERNCGQNGLPIKVPSAAGSAPSQSAVNFSCLSEEKMAVMSQLARRDLKNRNLQKTSQPPSPECVQHLVPRPQQPCTRSHVHKTRGLNKPRHPLTVKEKNGVFGAVQTPPPVKPTTHYLKDETSFLSTKNVSLNTSKDSDMFFPAKILPAGVSSLPQDEISKIQGEMLTLLQVLQTVQERALSEHSLAFLRLPVRLKEKAGYLPEEENLERALVRLEEQRVRSARNVYNLKQKVGQLQKEAASHVNKPLKQQLLSAHLMTNHRIALKCLQAFVKHLPFHELERGLPAVYHDLASVIQQLAALSAVSRQEDSHTHRQLAAILDHIQNLNSQWCRQLKTQPSQDRKVKDWVSDTKLEQNLLLNKNKVSFGFVPRPTAQRKKQRRGAGKENKLAASDERKSQLQKGIAYLLQNKSTGDGISYQEKLGKPAFEKVQVGSSWDDLTKHYLTSTVATRSKTAQRSSSAPSSPEKKEVNFDLHRSPSPPAFRVSTPFYVGDMTTADVREHFPVGLSKSGVSKLQPSFSHDTPASNQRSLSEGHRLRSADVSNSFIDEVEHRLLQRLKVKPGQGQQKIVSQGLQSDDPAIPTRSKVKVTDDEIKSAAVTLMDAPTLENISLRLTEMQREEQEIRKRWSTLKFIKPRAKMSNEPPHQPPAIEVARLPQPTVSEVPNWPVEPVIFTNCLAKPVMRQVHTIRTEPVHKKQLVSLKQTSVERIMQSRSTFQTFLRKRSHHPTGRFDPWKLVEQVADEILQECLQDVASEVESVNEDIASHMFQTEFKVDPNQFPGHGQQVGVKDHTVTFATDMQDVRWNSLGDLGVEPTLMGVEPTLMRLVPSSSRDSSPEPGVSHRQDSPSACQQSSADHSRSEGKSDHSRSDHSRSEGKSDHSRSEGKSDHSRSEGKSDHSRSDHSRSEGKSDHSRSEGKSDHSRSEGKSDHSRSEGKSDHSRSEGKSDHSRSEGKSDHSRSEGKSDHSRSEGKSDHSRSEGKSDHSRSEGKSDHSRSDHSRSEGKSDHSRSEGKSDHSRSEGKSDHSRSEGKSDHSRSEGKSDHSRSEASYPLASQVKENSDDSFERGSKDEEKYSDDGFEETDDDSAN
ncbi:protein moonraker-like isoform X3 [Physella acuta]|uniref:protein moonraker-like isoform X3 n=1 Tax=Physella acuta TaxID=109671 RepID=UPI0027DB8C4B|nr:protein moonraker-like isoform X3 [Physella acuta]